MGNGPSREEKQLQAIYESEEASWLRRAGAASMDEFEGFWMASTGLSRLGPLALAAGDPCSARDLFERAGRSLAASRKEAADKGDEEQVRRLDFAEKIDAWRVGDCDRFMAFVREESAPPDSVIDLAAFPSLALRWALAGRSWNRAAWIAAMEVAREARVERLVAELPAIPLDVTRGILVSERFLQFEFWLRRFDLARGHAEDALAALERWNESRERYCAHLSFDSRKVWEPRTRALLLLLSRSGDRRKDELALKPVRKAMIAAAKALDPDLVDLALLHLVATAAVDPEAELVASFRSAFPHLEHLLDLGCELPDETT